MSRQNSKLPAFFLIALMVFTGCHPTQPFYLQNDGDLSHYIDTATELESPDVAHRTLDEVRQVHSPFTLTHPEFTEYWDLTLEECVAMALQNSKNIRQGGGVNVAINQTTTALGRFNASGNSIYDPAVFESSTAGVEAALSRFDAQFTSSLTINTTDRPQNFLGQAGNFFATVLTQNDANFSAEINKISAVGTQYFLRHTIGYNRGNRGGGSRALSSVYTSAIEMEARHPLLRGSGALVNRTPVVISRINTDMQLAQFEARVRDIVYNTERAYWDLYCAYHILETAKISRDSVKETRDLTAASFPQLRTKQDLEQANEQYFFFRSLLQAALAGDSNTGAAGVFESERALRFLLGLAATDGRLIRPIDEPTTARVEFDWHDIHTEAMVRSPELREQQWLIKRRENELILVRNQLLPQMDLTLLYRWLGVGDVYGSGNRRGLDFPAAGSSSLDSLTQGDYQEASVGLNFTPPKFGARAELAGVRNGQLNLAREHARIEDMELELSHLLSSAVRNLDSQFKITQSNFNRWVASEDEVRLRLVEWKLGKAQPLDTLLDAQRRMADSRAAFFRTLCAYNKAIATVHYQKGSILEYDGVMLAEGPWPKKAYWDALGHARRRDSSYYLDYGWTRPGVISKGPIEQDAHGISEGEEMFYESIPAGQPTPAPQEEPIFTPAGTHTHAAAGNSVVGGVALTSASGDASSEAFVWDLGLSSGQKKKAASKRGGVKRSQAAAPVTFDAQVRPASKLQWVESKAEAK